MAIKSYTVKAAEQYIKAMFYGDPGTGKTTTAVSCQDHEKMKDVIHLNVEGGLMSVAHREDFKAIDITESGQVGEFFWKLIKHKQDGKGRYANVNTVILDNSTELQSINIQEIVDARIAITPPTENPDPDEIYQEDWGKSTTQIKRLFRWFRQAPVNFIATAHVRKVYPKGRKGRPDTAQPPLAIQPAMTPSLGEAIMGYMDFVWFFYTSEVRIKGTDRTKMTCNILTQPEGVHFAKTRGPRFAAALGKHRRLPLNKGMAEIYDLFLDTFKPEESRNAEAVR